jgi:hypothetical protein
MSNPKDEQIRENAVGAFFSSIQNSLDPKGELDLGGWAGITYDGHPDFVALNDIAARVLAAHRAAVAEADAEAGSPSLDSLCEAAHGLELAAVAARSALCAAQDGQAPAAIAAKVGQAQSIAAAAIGQLGAGAPVVLNKENAAEAVTLLLELAGYTLEGWKDVLPPAEFQRWGDRLNASLAKLGSSQKWEDVAR